MATRIQIPIEMVDVALASLTSTKIWDQTKTNFDTTDYDGNPTYTFEIVANNFNAATTYTVAIVNGAGSALATITLSGGTGADNPKRYTASFTPTNGADTYRVQTGLTTSGDDVEVYVGRIVVAQDTSVTKTRVQIPLANTPTNLPGASTTSTIDTFSSGTFSQPRQDRYSLFSFDASRFVTPASTNPYSLEASWKNSDNSSQMKAALFDVGYTYSQGFSTTSLPVGWTTVGNTSWTFNGSTAAYTTAGSADPNKLLYTAIPSSFPITAQTDITFTSDTGDRIGVTVGSKSTGAGLNVVFRNGATTSLLYDGVAWIADFTDDAVPAIGETWTIKGFCDGTTLKGKAWKQGTSEPDWQVSGDVSGNNLTGLSYAGIVGDSISSSYAGAFDNFSVTAVNATANEVVGSEITSSSSTQTTTVGNWTSDANWNSGHIYELRLQRTSGAGTCNIDKAALYIRLTNPSAIDVYWRLAKNMDSTSSFDAPYQRLLYTSTNYSNPILDYQVTARAITAGTNNTELIDSSTQDQGTGSASHVSTITPAGTTKTQYTNPGISLTSGDRFYTKLNVTTGEIAVAMAYLIVHTTIDAIDETTTPNMQAGIRILTP